jgi:hypothetical protein
MAEEENIERSIMWSANHLKTKFDKYGFDPLSDYNLKSILSYLNILSEEITHEYERRKRS